MLQQDFDVALVACAQTLESLRDIHVFRTAFCHITHSDVQIFAFLFRSVERRCYAAWGPHGGVTLLCK
jgi:hypothetical protein